MARKLDRLNGSNDKGVAFQRLWQRNCETVESNFSDLAAQLALITAAQAAADAVRLTDKISGSSVVPANVLTATDAGTDATVMVAAHTRVYGDGTQLAVGAHTFTGQPYGVKRAVYYDDTTCANAAPTYHITATLSNAVPNFAPGRHSVGTITTPASGGGGTTGGVTSPGGDPADRPDMGTL